MDFPALYVPLRFTLVNSLAFVLILIYSNPINIFTFVYLYLRNVCRLATSATSAGHQQINTFDSTRSLSTSMVFMAQLL
jgi:hypothetical protein